MICLLTVKLEKTVLTSENHHFPSLSCAAQENIGSLPKQHLNRNILKYWAHAVNKASGANTVLATAGAFVGAVDRGTQVGSSPQPLQDITHSPDGISLPTDRPQVIRTLFLFHAKDSTSNSIAP